MFALILVVCFVIVYFYNWYFFSFSVHKQSRHNPSQKESIKLGSQNINDRYWEQCPETKAMYHAANLHRVFYCQLEGLDP